MQSISAKMPQISLSQGDGLLIVDLQNDFLPGGALGVHGGDLLIPVINEIIRKFREAGLPTYASRDWHPPEHCSFRGEGGPWPAHCVAGSPGAEFPAMLNLPPDVWIVSKATEVGMDAYSAFDQTTLAARLQADRVERLFVCGLATEYCVLSSAEDALRLGFRVVLVRDACAAIEKREGDEARALGALERAGATLLEHNEIAA
ncbi:MAG: isochorismatase family protein [Gammaproteobacteria bacterium]